MMGMMKMRPVFLSPIRKKKKKNKIKVNKIIHMWGKREKRPASLFRLVVIAI